MTTWHPLSAKVGNHFADKRRSLGRYSTLADSDHGVGLLFLSVWPNHILLFDFSNDQEEIKYPMMWGYESGEKTSLCWDITPCFAVSEKHVPALLAICFKQVSCLAHSSTVTMKAILSTECRVPFNEPHGAISRNTELFKTHNIK
jgi:hypothetical protein